MAITYSAKTVQEMYDDIIIELGEHRVAENIDFGTVLSFINSAVKEVIALTLPYKDWAYTQRVAVTNYETSLQPDYIKYKRCMLRELGSSDPYREARYVDIREFFTLNTWYNAHSWNRALYNKPVFTIWGYTEVSIGRLACLTAPSTIYETGTVPDGYTYNDVNMEGYLEYYAVPADLTTVASVIKVPYEFEELLMMSVMARIYTKTDEPLLLEKTQADLIRRRGELIQLMEEKRRVEKRELESFVEPVAPIVPPQPQQGEATKGMFR